MPEMMEQAIKQIKDSFQTMLAEELDLRRVTAPLFVRSGTGINDDLNGTERAVRFAVPALGGADVEIVHSLAKWKRIQLGAYGIPAGFGLYTDMNAVRADEELDNIHSIYVDQWDWERTIRAEDRNLEFLKGIVRRIYSVIRSQERRVYIPPHYACPARGDRFRPVRRAAPGVPASDTGRARDRGGSTIRCHFRHRDRRQTLGRQET